MPYPRLAIATTPEHARPQPFVRLARLVNTTIRSFFYDRCTQQAAGIAYRVLFALAPLTIVLVWITSIVLSGTDFGDAVVDSIIDLLPVPPDSRDQVEAFVASVASPTSLAGFVALIGFAWTASGMVAAIRIGLERALHVAERAPIARRKAIDLLFVVGAGGLVAVMVAVGTLATLLRRSLQPLLERVGFLDDLLAPTVAPVVSGIAAALAAFVLYRFVPARVLSTRHALVGAAATGVMVAALAVASAFIYEATLAMSAIFGSLTTVFVFLYSVYLHSCALLLGAELAYQIGQPAELREPVIPALAQDIVTRARRWRWRRDDPPA